jgi:hypothetical protein
MNFYKLLSTFVGHFCPLESGSGFRIRIRIRLNTDPIRIRIPDPDPQHCRILRKVLDPTGSVSVSATLGGGCTKASVVCVHSCAEVLLGLPVLAELEVTLAQQRQHPAALRVVLRQLFYLTEILQFRIQQKKPQKCTVLRLHY